MVMRQKRAAYWQLPQVLVLLLVFVVSSTALADRAIAKWYRYYDNGVPQVTNKVTDAHLTHGYEELDASFRVIKKVSPYVEADREAAKEKEEEAAKADSAKQKLLQTYGSSERATRKRIELLGDISSKRGFAQQQLNVATLELNKELSKAASIERSGKPVPEILKKNIETKRAAVDMAQMSISDLMTHQMERVHALTRDIRKLRRIEQSGN